jgi:HPr kinase/phosphorylase
LKETQSPGSLRSIPVNELYADRKYGLGLKLAAGRRGLKTRKVMSLRIEKPGIKLTDRSFKLHQDRVQILGEGDVTYLRSLPERKLSRIRKNFVLSNVPCLVTTNGLKLPDSVVRAADAAGLPVFVSSLKTLDFIKVISVFLEHKLAERTRLHGVLLDVLGVGVLIIGKSGIGKSECALELICNGQRLVADDLVEVEKQDPSQLFGSGPDMIRYMMEIRGLGIINIKEIFGISSVRSKKLVELVIELVEWEPDTEYDRLGLDARHYEILGVELPLLRLPIRPGRNMSSIIEVAARNYLLRRSGYNSAVDVQNRFRRKVAESDLLVENQAR